MLRPEGGYFVDLHGRYSDSGLAIIALAFERTNDFKRSKIALERVKHHYDVQYPILFAGKASQGAVNQLLPQMSEMLSYPTSLIFDKNSQIKSIHTGFNGPATGEAFQNYQKETEALIKELLK